jgi:hypothetical protein
MSQPNTHIVIQVESTFHTHFVRIPKWKGPKNRNIMCLNFLECHNSLKMISKFNNSFFYLVPFENNFTTPYQLKVV